MLVDTFLLLKEEKPLYYSRKWIKYSVLNTAVPLDHYVCYNCTIVMMYNIINFYVCSPFVMELHINRGVPIWFFGHTLIFDIDAIKIANNQ